LVTLSNQRIQLRGEEEAEITAVRAKFALLQEESRKGWETVKEQQNVAFAAWRSPVNEAKIEAEARYPDLAGQARFYATCWKPIEDFEESL